jgi:hypothetical protein
LFRFSPSFDSQSIRAHFDGEHILLDEPVKLEPNTRLIVTVLSPQDSDRDHWLTLSKKRLEAADENGEEEYPLDLIKEPNTEYEAR